MKSIHPFSLFMATVLMAFTACTHENSEQILQEKEIKLKSQIATSDSRGTNLNQQSTQIVEGQQVGVTITGALAEHNNVAWTVGEEGTMTTGNPPCWNNSNVSITAYHPYNAEWTSNLHNFTVQTNQSTDAGFLNSDLLWTSTTANPTSEPVSLKFKHMLAKINVILSSDDYASLKGATISIIGTKTSVEFIPTTGVLGTVSNEADIVAAVTTDDAYTATAIIVPQEMESGAKFIQAEINGQTFSFYLPSTKKFESGHSYTYKLKVKGNTLDIDSDGITDWEDEVVTPDGDDKKLIGATLELSYGKAMVTFRYDNNGHLVYWGGTNESFKDGSSSDYNYTLTWEGNKCTEKCDEIKDIIVYYTFSNNLMKTSTWGNWIQTFTYNDAKQLVRIDHSYTDDEDTNYETFHWMNDNLMQIETSRGSITELTYSETSFKGFNPAIFLFDNIIIEDVNLVLSNPELLGLQINNLVTRITHKYSSNDTPSVYDFTYNFNSDGYISYCKVVEDDGDTEVYTFEWE